jgi:hypothetical protein
MSEIKVLVYIVHYFNPLGVFNGKSKYQEPNTRRQNLLKCINAVKGLNYDIEIKICGFGNNYLIPIDVDFSNKIDNPQLIVFEVLANLHQDLDYDFVIVMEDDILINSSSVTAAINFTFRNSINSVYHPHRLEIDNNKNYNSIDIMLLPGKTGKYILNEGHRLAEFMNPHAAFLLLSKQQVIFASKKVDLKLNYVIFGGYMASAFYNYLKPFTLYRDNYLPYYNYNIHLDPIVYQPSWRNKIKRLLVNFLETYICEYGKIFGPYTK